MDDLKDTQHPNVEISVQNFGPIVEADIDLRPLTVFVGPSNTGKTYFATLVYVLHGVFNDLSGLSLLSRFGPGKAMSILSELLSSPATLKEEIPEILKKLVLDEEPFKLSDMPKEVRQRLEIVINDTDFFAKELQNELKNCFDLNSISELMHLTGEQRNETSVLLRISERDQEYWNIRMRISTSEVNLDNLISLDTPANENMVLLPKEWSVFGGISFEENRVRIGSDSYPHTKKTYYLPAARNGIMQSHRIIVSSLVKRTTRVGLENFPEVPTMSGVIADFIERIILYEEKKISNEEMKHLSEILESEVLAGQILLKPTPSGYPDFYYRPQGIEEDIRLSQTSSMVSELAPLVLYLRSLVQPDDTLIIEEPEAHLHPGAQADMAVILARLVRAGVRVIITTHSDWILQEIGNLVLEGLLEDETDEPASWLLPEEVGVWHFQKDEPVKEIPFKSREGISPEDYEDVAEGLYNRSVNLQQRLEKKEGKRARESA